MVLHRVRADAEPVGDLAVAHAGDDEPEHVALAARSGRCPWAGRPCPGRVEGERDVERRAPSGRRVDLQVSVEGDDPLGDRSDGVVVHVERAGAVVAELHEQVSGRRSPTGSAPAARRRRRRARAPTSGRSRGHRARRLRERATGGGRFDELHVEVAEPDERRRSARRRENAPVTGTSNVLRCRSVTVRRSTSAAEAISTASARAAVSDNRGERSTARTVFERQGVPVGLLGGPVRACSDAADRLQGCPSRRLNLPAPPCRSLHAHPIGRGDRPAGQRHAHHDRSSIVAMHNSSTADALDSSADELRALVDTVRAADQAPFERALTLLTDADRVFVHGAGRSGSRSG